LLLNMLRPFEPRSQPLVVMQAVANMRDKRKKTGLRGGGDDAEGTMSLSQPWSHDPHDHNKTDIATKWAVGEFKIAWHQLIPGMLIRGVHPETVRQIADDLNKTGMWQVGLRECPTVLQTV